MIVLWLLKRILTKTTLVWRARELEVSGANLWRRVTLLRLRRDHSLVTYCARRKLESDSRKLESDIFGILESEGVTEIGALYKVSPSKFLLIFGSKTAKEKLSDTAVQFCFGDSEICWKRVGTLRDGRNLSLPLSFFLSSLVARQWDWIELNWNTLFNVDNNWKYKISYIAHITMNMSN